VLPPSDLFMVDSFPLQNDVGRITKII
jgi:hypothetical protein